MRLRDFIASSTPVYSVLSVSTVRSYRTINTSIFSNLVIEQFDYFESKDYEKIAPNSKRGKNVRNHHNPVSTNRSWLPYVVECDHTCFHPS